MTMQIYIAGASAEWERVRALADDLEAHLDVKAFPWWELGPLGKDEELSTMAAAITANLLWDAVRKCDAFILVLPATATRGAWFELGLACGLPPSVRPIVYAQGAPRQSVFEELCYRVDGFDALCAALERRGASPRRRDGAP